MVIWDRALTALLAAAPLLIFLSLTWSFRPRGLARAVPYLILAGSLALAGASLRDHALGSREHHQRAGPESFQQPLPEELVRQARRAMDETDRWTPRIGSYACNAPEFPHYWLRYRLLPNAMTCEDPDVLLVVESDGSWAVTRP